MRFSGCATIRKGSRVFKSFSDINNMEAITMIITNGIIVTWENPNRILKDSCNS